MRICFRIWEEFASSTTVTHRVSGRQTVHVLGAHSRARSDTLEDCSISTVSGKSPVSVVPHQPRGGRIPGYPLPPVHTFGHKLATPQVGLVTRPRVTGHDRSGLVPTKSYAHDASYSPQATTTKVPFHREHQEISPRPKDSRRRT